METATLNYDFALRDGGSVREDGDVLRIAGVASNFDLDRQGDRMSRDAFKDSLAKYMRNPILLYAHRPSVPLGRVTKAEVRSDGLYVEAEIPRPEAGSEAAQVWRLIKSGVIKAFSVGGRALRDTIYGRQTIVAWDLQEISVAPLGVNPGTLFSLKQQAGKAFGDAAMTRAEVLDLVENELTLLSLRAEVLGWRLT